MVGAVKSRCLTLLKLEMLQKLLVEKCCKEVAIDGVSHNLLEASSQYYLRYQPNTKILITIFLHVPSGSSPSSIPPPD